MYACLVVGLLLLAAPAGALVPDTITIDLNSSWVTAGSSIDAVTVTVQVSNSTSGNTSFGGVAVDFAVDSAYGSISPVSTQTNGDGEATAVFRPAQRSGDAAITARFSSQGREVSNATVCRVDHAAPYVIADILYEPEVTVAETTAIAVRVADRYGNPVDSRWEDALNKTPETVYFMVGSPTGNATFVGGTDEISVQVDAAGNATAVLQVDTAAGENLVFIQPPVPVRSGYISITGVADGVPSSIIQVVDPVSASVPADGDKVVEFTYTLLDGYGNLVAGQGLWVNASIQREGRPAEQENALLYSNSRGQVMITYGPEDSVGIVTITATAAANPNVSVSQEVEFTSTDPVNILLSANPQSMPSRDVKADTVSQIRAKVMDVKGNPVEGETVTFEIVPGSVDVGAYNQTEAPYLDAASVGTDVNGYAIVGFHPGAFTTDRNAPDWSGTATGTATVRATWNDTTRTISLTWKNYPYLSVETAVSPETVAVNETVNVTIRLRGDGWALQPDPIDVVLVIDRSGSMGYTDVSPTRMAAAKAAANDFVDQMNSTNDRVGLVSFASDARLDASLTNDKVILESKIDGLTPTGATNMRQAFYKAISHLRDNGRPEAVKAVILMSDGDWNYHGTPLAHGIGLQDWTWSGNTITYDYYEYYDGLGGTLEHGKITVPKVGYGGGYYYDTEWTDYCPSGIGEITNQNMSNYAIANDISLYTITFAYNPGEMVRTAMGTLANSTGGFYEHAPDGDDLTEIYERIAGVLKTEASVDTELDVVFENVEVNEGFVSGADVFDYVYEYGASTTVESWVDNETGHYNITPFTTIDQTSDWNADQNLHFDIGTVRLGQTWETTFRLKVLTDGNINVFGPGSTISFNNGTDSLELPDTFITAHHLNNTGIDFGELNISDLRFTGEEPVDEFLPVAWDLNYTGLYGVTQDVFYSNDNEYTWVRFDRISATNETTSGESTLYVRDLPAGIYIIRVYCYAPDTEDASARLAQEVVVGENGSTYIQLR